MPSVCRDPAALRSPGAMTTRAEMMVSSCRTCRQRKGIQSEGGHPPAPVFCGEAKLGVLWLTPGQPWLVAQKQKPGLVHGEQRRCPCGAGQGSLARAQREVPGECQ